MTTDNSEITPDTCDECEAEIVDGCCDCERNICDTCDGDIVDGSCACDIVDDDIDRYEADRADHALWKAERAYERMLDRAKGYDC